MKCFVFCVLAVLSLGRCAEECPAGTHAYNTNCGYLVREATCNKPQPEQGKGSRLCDYTACYCDEPTVRDENTHQCVTVDQCT